MSAATHTASRKTLTIGMATYDDYDGVYFTLQGIRLFHPEIAGEIEIIVVDNHPDGACAGDLKALENWVPGYRYIPCNWVQGTAVRDVVFREARGDFVLCVDCHVMFVPGSLRKLLDYFEAHPDTPDLLQGPLVYDDLQTFSTHMERTWSAGMYGVWGSDRRAADPRRRRSRSACKASECSPAESCVAGIESAIARLRRRGGLYAREIPARWRPRAFACRSCVGFIVSRVPWGCPYTNTWEDRIRNYLIIADELGQDPAPALEHFRGYLGRENADRIIASVRGEFGNPFDFFSAIYCINLPEQTIRWREVTARFERLGITDRVRRFDAIRSEPNHHVGCGLSHRAVVAQAKAQGLENVLVFEDDVLFTNDAVPALRTGLDELRGRYWKFLYLGACRWRREFPLLPGARRLAQAGPVTCAHALAYHNSVYDRILHDVPGDPPGMEGWLQTHHGIDQYYAFSITEDKYLLSPVIATQANILPMESPDVQQRLLP